jgi:hypothetical protein
VKVNALKMKVKDMKEQKLREHRRQKENEGA